MEMNTGNLGNQTPQAQIFKWAAVFIAIAALAWAHNLNMIVTGDEFSFGFGLGVTTFLLVATIAFIALGIFASKQVRYGTYEEWQDKRNTEYVDILVTTLVCVTLIAFTASMPFEFQTVSFDGWKMTSQSNQVSLVSSYVLWAFGLCWLPVIVFCQFAEIYEARKRPQMSTPQKVIVPVKASPASEDSSFYGFLESKAFLLCLLFGTFPLLMTPTQRYLGGDVGALYAWVVTITSLITFVTCVLWMKSQMVSKRLGYLLALTFGSLLGCLIGGSAIFGMYGSKFGGQFFNFWTGMPSQILSVLMLIALLYQVMLNSRMRSIQK